MRETLRLTGNIIIVMIILPVIDSLLTPEDKVVFTVFHLLLSSDPTTY